MTLLPVRNGSRNDLGAPAQASRTSASGVGRWREQRFQLNAKAEPTLPKLVC
jgi:hypothetical protein